MKGDEIISCPNGKSPESQEADDDKTVAYFCHNSCKDCKLDCIIKKNKIKSHRLVIKKSQLESEKRRELFNDAEYLRKCRLRPAVEGTMFQMKLHMRNGKSRFRGKIKIRGRSILRAMAINFKRVSAFLKSKSKKELNNFVFNIVLLIFKNFNGFFSKNHKIA